MKSSVFRSKELPTTIEKMFQDESLTGSPGVLRAAGRPYRRERNTNIL